jgi:nicotinate-nucleotide adenylyltransferase
VGWQLHLDRVLFLPARQNPLKRGETSTPAEQRCEMVRLAIADNPLFELSALDLDRPPPSYTADLLRSLEGENRSLFFIVGADILPELPRWRAPAEILRLACLAVVTRPGAPAPDLDAVDRVLPGLRERVELVDIPALAIASRELRERVRNGQPIRYLTPPAVERYIAEYRLYR